ncbi:MAG: sulfatase-like hydrolase/transferase, partial [bacterium]
MDPNTCQSRREFLKTSAAAFAAGFLPGRIHANAVTGGKPNIVFFLVDDMGWQDTSVPFHTEPTPFNGFYRTPNMERLAETGIKFTNAYACPLCSPTRTSIMTGQNAARHRVTQWTLYPDRDQSEKNDLLASPPWRVEGLQPGNETLASALGKQGYRTIHVGKAHWGATGTPGSEPKNLGFDVNIAGHAAGGPGHYYGIENFGNKKGEHTLPWGVPGLEKYHGKDVNLTDVLTIEANQAVKQAVDDGKPFYLYMSHYAVHATIREHKPYQEHYLDKDVDPIEMAYASMIEG